jgi:hypothetical protein
MFEIRLQDTSVRLIRIEHPEAAIAGALSFLLGEDFVTESMILMVRSNAFHKFSGSISCAEGGGSTSALGFIVYQLLVLSP